MDLQDPYQGDGHGLSQRAQGVSPKPFTKERLEEDIITKIERLSENQKALVKQKETPTVATYVQAHQFIRLEKEYLRLVKQLNKLKNELCELQQQ
ncbi:MAG: hypothetical protein GTN76_15385 [Candidatus Aenigmarchaeota archaeon]|nr:hypothetical protein [Candidatus Aenigmarchaeota archaeon]